jgi:hypothetical protein
MSTTPIDVLPKKKNYAGGWKNTPHINYGKGATLLPGIVNSFTERKRKRSLGIRQEGCKLDLKPSPYESW